MKKNPENLPDSVGKRLKAFAVERYGSIVNLEKALKKSKNYLSSYLSDRSLPGSPLLKELAEVGCDITWLLTGTIRSNTDLILQRLDKIEQEITSIKAENYDLLVENKGLKQEILQKDESIEALFNELGKIHLASSQLEALRNIVSIKK